MLLAELEDMGLCDIMGHLAEDLQRSQSMLFFPLSGVEACKYAVFGNRFRLIFQQLPREFRDF